MWWKSLIFIRHYSSLPGHFITASTSRTFNSTLLLKIHIWRSDFDITEIYNPSCCYLSTDLSSSWLLWGGVGREAGTFTVLGPWARARASSSSSALNCSGRESSPLVTVETQQLLTLVSTVQYITFCDLNVVLSLFWAIAINCSPSWPTMTPPLLASSSVVAKPLSNFWRATGGGVGGREAGGVGGLLKLFCCREIKIRVTICTSHTWNLISGVYCWCHETWCKS